LICEIASDNRIEFDTKLFDKRLEKRDTSESYVFLYYFYASGRYEEKEYYYSYDANSFLADAGGYLGLVLGHSLLSFYDVMQSGLARLCNRK
jgi:hypothetical protein